MGGVRGSGDGVVIGNRRVNRTADYAFRLVDRLIGGRVSIYGGLEARTRMAAMATAAALLLARDPLAPPE